MANFTMILRELKHYRRFFILVLTPLIFAPIPLAIGTPPAKAAYGVAVMATYWITEVTPLAVTSLLPLVIFPMLGLIKGKEVCMVYMKDTNILLLGGLIVAIAIEYWDLHKRIALKVLLLVGAQPRRIMLGFMLTTGFISMFISNTASTAMMTPIMEAVLKKLDEQKLAEAADEDMNDEDEKVGIGANEIKMGIYNGELRNDEIGDQHGAEMKTINQTDITIRPSETRQNLVSDGQDDDATKVPMTPEDQRHQQLGKAMMLCICYAANIGGTGTINGTTPQLVLAGQMKEVFPDGPDIGFLYWFVYAFPQMLIFLFISWLYLQFMFFGISWKHLCFCFRGKKRNKTKGAEAYAIIKQQYDGLGPMTYAEKNVLIMFIALVLLWFFRDPKIFTGWSAAFKYDEKGGSYMTDGTPAMVIAFLLFQLPSQKPDIPFLYKNFNRAKLKSKTILEWMHVQTNFPWNVLLLLGAGYGLAKACEDSCLSYWLSFQLRNLKSLPVEAIAFIVAFMLTFLTEITSNTATASILLPILGSLAQGIQVHPLYLMMPAAVCASFAFMLPVATPPNAIVFGTGRISVTDMAKAGFGLNIIGILIVTLGINTWGKAYYGLAEFPTWAVAAAVAGGNSTVAPHKCASQFPALIDGF